MINKFYKVLIIILIFMIQTCNNSTDDLKKYFAFLGSSSVKDNPKIFSSVPSNGDKNLPRTQKISILFDRPMKMNTCQQAFSIQPPVRGFFDNTDTSLRFSPSSQMELGTYSLTITKFCEDTNGRDIKEIFSISFSIGDSSQAGSNPTVVSTSVFAGSAANCNSSSATNTNFLSSDVTTACMGNPTKNKISIQFSKPMEKSLTQASVGIAPNLTGSFVWENDTLLSFTPDLPLQYNIRYSLNITTNAQDLTAQRLLFPITSSFLVGTPNLIPTIVSTSVFAGTILDCNSATAISTSFLTTDVTTACMGNPTKNKISIQFSRNMEKSLTGAAVNISPTITGSFVWDTDSLLSFTPDLPLQFNQRYTVNISTNAQDLNFQKILVPSISSFLVGTADLIPIVNSIQVRTETALNCSLGLGTNTNILAASVNNACLGNPAVNPIEIQFSVPMDTSVTQNSVSISPSLSGIYTWTAGNTLLTFTPNSPLQEGTTYTITVGKLAQSTNSISLLANVVGSFIADPNAGNAILTSINISQGTIANCNAGTGTNIDILINNVVNGCLGNPTINPIVFNFAFAMNPTLTEQAISFSPNIAGTFVWSGGNTILTFTPNSKLDYGVQYSVIINQSAVTAANVNLANNVIRKFVAGEIITNPKVVAFGLESQATCPNTLPAPPFNVGANVPPIPPLPLVTWASATCFWDHNKPVLSPSYYRYRGGDNGTGFTGSPNACADVNTDNFRIIFNSYMDINTTISAISLKRLSPPLTTIALATWNWTDCQATFPFGCRVVTLSFAEQESSCNGTLFGNLATGGDFNLSRTDTAPANLPIYQINVNNTAKDVNGVFLTPFSFSMEGK